MIYITGASGRLGKEILKKIPNAIPLVRTKKGLKNEIVTNFSEKELKKILKNAKILIHLAGSMNFIDPTEMLEVNVHLTQRIVNSVPKNSRIIFASSISVYGKDLKEIPADENTPVNPDSVYSKSKFGAEGIVLQHPDYVILRIGNVYGPGFEDYTKILQMIKEGKMYQLGNGQNKIPFVHVEDVADAVKNSLKAEKGTYLVCGESLTQEEIFRISAEELGVNPPRNYIPVSMALAMMKIEEQKAIFMNKKPKLTQEHILVLSSNREFDSSKAKKELGFKPRPLKKGIKELVKSIYKDF